MDPNRRSGTASYYDDQQRRQSQAAYSHRPAQSTSSQAALGMERDRRDSSATLFNNMNQPRSTTPGGYNQASYTKAGRAEPVKGGWEEEQDVASAQTGNDNSWDVYADFNNSGPKYSSAYGQDHLYEAVGTPGTPGAKGDYDDSTLAGPGSRGQVEMVTVPALGAEWKSDELRGMTSSGKRQRKAEARAEKWKNFRQGRSGLCGVKWLNRKTLTFFIFFLIIIASVTLAFTIPRVPGFALSVDHPLVNATGNFASLVPTLFVRAPNANFSFPAAANLQLDTHSSYLALKMTNLQAEVFDSGTGRLIATGNITTQRLPAKEFVPLVLPLEFSYLALNESDQTWQNWYKACRNPQASTDGKRPGVNFRISLSYNIFGLLSKQRTSTDVLNADCPIILSPNAG